jgi:hypothetical protein
MLCLIGSVCELEQEYILAGIITNEMCTYGNNDFQAIILSGPQASANPLFSSVDSVNVFR